MYICICILYVHAWYGLIGMANINNYKFILDKCKA